MSEQLQLRRGTAAQVTAFTGAQGETIVDTTNNRLVVQDGATAGGFAAAKLSEVITNTRTQVNDAAYTVQTTDRMVAFIALSAARTVSLPAAASFPTGVRLIVIDESGACSSSNAITVARAGADLVNGSTTAVISVAYGYMAIESNGTNKWTIVDQSAGGSLGNISALGIGTAADPTNPLSVTANTALFNELGTGAGGTGDFRIKLNKASSSNTASTQYQDALTSHAEVGLCGDDNFHFRVSPDGSTWYDAIIINSSTGLASMSPAVAFGFANRFRNGTMDIAQRGAGPLTVSTSGAYTLDGWIVLPSGASVSAQQVSGRGPTLYSLKATGATSVTDVVVKQRIESFMAAVLAGQTITVQAQIYNSTGAAITPTLTVRHANTADTWSSSTADVSAVSLQSCANGAWTKVAYTYTDPGTAANGLEFAFDFGNNFGSSSNSIQITEADVRVTPNCATGLNGNPPAPELRPVAIETQTCRRYFYEWNAANGDGYSAFGVGNLFSTTQFDIPFFFPVVMRAAPTVTFASLSAFWCDGSHGQAPTALSSIDAMPDVTTIRGTLGTAETAGYGAKLRANASTAAYIQFSAEL